MASSTSPKEWRRDGFLVSTDRELLSISAINEAFAGDDMYWATPLPEEKMKAMLSDSFCFGLYKTAQEADSEQAVQIGFARAITDNTTFVYLTDVYVLKDFRDTGLGTWLIQCVKEWIDGIEYLRKAMLITSNGRAVGYYEKLLGMSVFGRRDKAVVMDWSGPGATFR